MINKLDILLKRFYKKRKKEIYIESSKECYNLIVTNHKEIKKDGPVQVVFWYQFP